MGIIVLSGHALAYIILTLAGQPAAPPPTPTPTTTRHERQSRCITTAAIWPVCQMTEDATLGNCAGAGDRPGLAPTARRIIRPYCCSAATADTYPDFIDDSEKRPESRLTASSSPRTANMHGGRGRRSLPCAAISRPIMPCWPPSPTTAAMWSMSSALTKLASINDIVNLVESVSLS